MVGELKDVVRGAKIVSLKKEELRLEQECVSIQDRIADVQWRIEGQDDLGSYDGTSLMNERQRAIDKLRETRKELFEVREELIEMGAR